MEEKKLRTTTRKIVFFVFVIVGLGGLIYFMFLIPYFQFPARPIVSDGKDWLDVLSSLGQFFGFVALFALIFEMYIRKEEEKLKTTPILKVETIDLVSTLPDPNHPHCYISEAERPEINDINYIGLWHANRPRIFSSFLCISIKNYQNYYEASAKLVRIKVKIIYSKTSVIAPAQSVHYSLWLPPRDYTSKLSVEIGDTKQVFIKLGMDDYEYVQVVVEEFEYQNLRKNNYNSNKIGVESYSSSVIHYYNNQPN